MSVTFDFSDKVAVVTGGSSGIGAAVARALGRAGAAVVIGSRDAAGQHVVDDIVAAGGRATHAVADVSDDAAVAVLVQTAVDTYGGLDIAVNNAGSLPPTGTLAEQTVRDWQHTLAVDLSGVFFSLRHEIPALLARGGGSIVNIASVAGVIADPGMSPYAAAKHGVVDLTRAAALDYAREGVRVNAVAPGLVRTPMIDGWLADPAMRETVLSYSPQGRVSEPKEIANLVLFLASDASPFINGSVYTIDGGQTAH